MASIVKRRNRYSVVYNITDENGVKRQKWETFATNADAKKRKAQIEYEQQNGTFIVPSSKTVHDLLEDYVAIYGVNTWAMSTYESKRGLIFNYIDPLIGDMKLDDLNTRVMDKFYQSLFKVKAKVVNNRKPKSEYLTVHTVNEIHKILRSAFKQAVKWELIAKNPVENVTIPKEEHAKREIWTVEDFQKALANCDDDNLSLALNLAFSCTLRIGEMLGITLDCIDVSDKSIEEGKASIYINKELQRVNREILQTLDKKDVLFIFPHTLSNSHTVLVLKKPKTDTSERRVYLPKTVALMVREKIKAIEEIKELFGDEYTDYNLLFAHSSGRPIEGQVINRAMKKLIKENDLPDVVFHSVRHSSITYKLKWTGGDIKAVQGDSGHARAEMVQDVYSHILDEDRRANARRFDENFYQQKPEEAKEEVPKAETQNKTGVDPTALFQLLADPEMAKAFQNLLTIYQSKAANDK